MTCELAASQVDFSFNYCLMIGQAQIDNEWSLSAATIAGFFPLIIYYGNGVDQCRKLQLNGLSQLLNHIGGHIVCEGQANDQDCVNQLELLRNQIFAFEKQCPTDGTTFKSTVNALYQKFRQLPCDLKSVGVTDPFNGAGDTALDLSLSFQGRFPKLVNGKTTRVFAIPDAEAKTAAGAVHVLQGVPGKPVPTIYVTCDTYTVDTWRIGAEATVIGPSVAKESPFDFIWLLDGTRLQQGITTTATSTTCELVTTSSTKSRHLELRATSKGGLLFQHFFLIATPRTREQCAPFTPPF